MEKFQIVKNLGNGTYGTVVEALNKTTREVVAIKKMKRKFETWDECMTLREVKSLRKLNHPNIVKLKEVIRARNELFLIFEFINGTVLDLIRKKQGRGGKGVDTETIRTVISQSLQGIQYCHAQGILHRDLKPENLLFSDGQLKIADFGLSKEIGQTNNTNYVSTRWYRAPEVILGSSTYDGKIDIFSLGCILAEMYSGDPLLPGNSEADMLFRLANLIGQPPQNWSTASKQGRQKIYSQFALQNPTEAQMHALIKTSVPQAPPAAIDLICKMIQWNPEDRPTAKDALNHPFFNNVSLYDNLTLSHDQRFHQQQKNFYSFREIPQSKSAMFAGMQVIQPQNLYGFDRQQNEVPQMRLPVYQTTYSTHNSIFQNANVFGGTSYDTLPRQTNNIKIFQQQQPLFNYSQFKLTSISPQYS